MSVILDITQCLKCILDFRRFGSWFQTLRRLEIKLGNVESYKMYVKYWN